MADYSVKFQPETTKESQTNMDTKTFTPDEVAEYLGDPVATDEHEVSIIATAIRVIGKYEPSQEDRNMEMVAAAMENLQDWCGDYGVGFDFEVIENQV